MASGFKSPQKKTKSFKALSIRSATLLTEKIGKIFSEVEDPRVERTRVHLLTDILIIAILSVATREQESPDPRTRRFWDQIMSLVNFWC